MVSQDSKVHVVMPTTQIVQMTPSNSITMTTNTQQHSNEDLIHEKMLKQQQEIDKLKQQLLSKEKQVQILQNQQLFQVIILLCCFKYCKINNCFRLLFCYIVSNITKSTSTLDNVFRVTTNSGKTLNLTI